MALDLGGSGGGALMLQEVLKNLAEKAYQNQQIQIASQRNTLEQQRLQNETALKNAALQSQDEERKARQADLALKGGEAFANTLPQGTSLTAPGIARLASAGMSGPEFVQHKDATLGSTNLSGAVQATGAAPRIVGLAQTANPGQAASDTFLGTAASQRAAQARQDKLAEIAQAAADKKAAAAESAANREDMIRLTASLRPPAQDHFDTTDIEDPNNPGKTIKVRINKQTGEISPLQMNGKGIAGNAPKLDATTANRLQSAKAVTQTGDDIIAQLRDPKTAAQLGAVMSRYNNLADFVGNAPPEWSKLAGLIESYSLANMGVHGMRSNTGAEAIKQTLGQQRHNPASMIAAIQGINGFANHLLENNGQGSTSAPAANADAAAKAAALIKKYGGG